MKNPTLLFLLLFLCIPFSSLLAQNCDAGTISFAPFEGQSNDTDGTVKYLCHDDRLKPIHNGDALLNDPDPSTSAGIGYLMYDCPPTVLGDQFNDIIDDPCVNHADATVPWAVYEQLDESWIFYSGLNGDAYSIKNSMARRFLYRYNGIDNDQYWFAPITLDNTTDEYRYSALINVNEGGCTSLREDQAFSVVLLEEIHILLDNSFIETSGTFTVKGGYPLHEAGASFQVSMTHKDDPSIVASLSTTTPINEQKVAFTVPQEGCYLITVEDGKSCASTVEICTYEDKPYDLFFEEKFTGDQNKTCQTIKANGLVNLTGYQFSILYDPTVLTLDELIPNTELPQTFVLGHSHRTQFFNEIRITTFDVAGLNHNFPDSTALFDICFEHTGQSQDCSVVKFDSDGTIGLQVELIHSGSSGPYAAPLDSIHFHNTEICLPQYHFVHPGDANNDGIANHFDVLWFGMAYEEEGAPREEASMDWMPQRFNRWYTSSPETYVDYARMDTDGNGQVTIDDFNALSLNWDKTHDQATNASPMISVGEGVPFTGILETKLINEGLSDGEYEILELVFESEEASVYGIAASLHYDVAVFEPEAMELLLQDSWLGEASELLFQYHNYPNEGRIDFAISRKDHIAVKGEGIIGTLAVKVALQDENMTSSSVYFEEVYCINDLEDRVGILGQNTVYNILDPLSSINHLNTTAIQCFPNPFNHTLTLDLDINLSTSVVVIDYLGRIIFQKEEIETTTTLDTSNWEEGIYVIQFQQKDQVIFSDKLLLMK